MSFYLSTGAGRILIRFNDTLGERKATALLRSLFLPSRLVYYRRASGSKCLRCMRRPDPSCIIETFPDATGLAARRRPANTSPPSPVQGPTRQTPRLRIPTRSDGQRFDRKR